MIYFSLKRILEHAPYDLVLSGSDFMFQTLRANSTPSRRICHPPVMRIRIFNPLNFPPLSPSWRRTGRLFFSLPKIKDIKIKRSLTDWKTGNLSKENPHILWTFRDFALSLPQRSKRRNGNHLQREILARNVSHRTDGQETR